jgi:hypothetical protein
VNVGPSELIFPGIEALLGSEDHLEESILQVLALSSISQEPIDHGNLILQQDNRIHHLVESIHLDHL